MSREFTPHPTVTIPAIQTALLDLIDTGRTGHDPTPSCRRCRTTGRCDRYPGCRWAPKHLRDALHRPDNDYQPTPTGTTRTNLRPDPVGATILVWESDVQRAVTALDELVTWTTGMTTGPGLQPHDEQGQPLTAPAQLPTRTTRAGRIVIDASPGRCRRWTLDACNWLLAVTDRLDALEQAPEPDRDRAEWLRVQTEQLRHRSHRLSRRLTGWQPPADLTVEPAPVRGVCESEGCGTTMNRATDRHRFCRNCRTRQTAERSA